MARLLLGVAVLALLAGCTALSETETGSLDGFTMRGVSCAAGGGAVDVNATREGGVRRVSVRGAVTTPTPCHWVNGTLRREDDGYVLAVTSRPRPGAEVCVQCVGTARYTATLTLPAGARLTVVHDDAMVATLPAG